MAKQTQKKAADEKTVAEEYREAINTLCSRINNLDFLKIVYTIVQRYWLKEA